MLQTKELRAKLRGPYPLKEQKRLQVIEKKERVLRFRAKSDPKVVIHDRRGGDERP